MRTYLPFFMLALFCGFLFSGCTTGASSLKLETMDREEGVFFGHIDAYTQDSYGNEEHISNSSIYHTCIATFEDEKNDTIVKVKMDKTGWLFASAKPGRVYLVDVSCTDGSFGGHVGTEQHLSTLFFEVSAQKSSYFGNLGFHFNYQGSAALGMFGLVGATIEASTSSSSKHSLVMKIEDKYSDGVHEFENRYENKTGNITTVDATIKEPAQIK